MFRRSPRRLSTGVRISIAIGVVASVAVLASGMIACGSKSAAADSGKKVIVLGFDGLDYELTQRLMAEGRMPNFSRLAAAGGFAPLETSVPPQSPVAWSNFITGMDSGGHGIYDFVHRDPETMLPYLSTSKTEDAGRILERVGRLRCGRWANPSPGVSCWREP